MDALDQLAKKIADLYKQNRNPPSTAPRIGKVVETNPLKIQWGENVLLTQDRLIIPKLYTTGYEIPNRWQNTNGSMVDDTLTWKVDLEPGDRVIIAPDESFKQWFIIDKI